MEVLNSWTKPLKSWTQQLYCDVNITFRILAEIVRGLRSRGWLGVLPGAGAQIGYQEPDLSLTFRTGAGATVIWEGPAPSPFLDANGFAE